MKEELKKSLTDLIDETLMELEELKKSRFSAAEVDLKGPGATELAGKPVNGKLAEKAEDKKDDEDKDEEAAEKAEGVNHAADADGGHHKVDKAEGVNHAADADGGHHKMDKAEDKKKDDDKDEDKEGSEAHEAKEKAVAKKLLDMHKDEDKKKDKSEDEDEKAEVKGLKKSVGEMESLMKSYVDQKVGALEGKLSSILEMVTKLGDQPVAAKGVSYKGVAPLQKSAEQVETLSKSEVASKLFELKKSGSKVDSTDIAMAEMGHDLEKIVSKYSIK